MSSEKFVIANRYSHVTKNLWSSCKVLADKYAKINLGQGAPDYNPPEAVSAALEAILEEARLSPKASAIQHQYAPLVGHAELVSALAKIYSIEFGRQIQPTDGSISVGVGAQGCLFNAFNAFVNPGDEVVIIEPYYDSYPSMVRAAGAKPVFVSLRPPPANDNKNITSANDWVWDVNQLTNAFSNRTKLLVLNSPQNPLGKVYSRSELAALAELCQRFDVVCVSDDVYEWTALADDGKRQRMANIEGMWERTVTIGSAGKCFNITGWRIGWCVGPPSLIRHVVTVQGEAIYSVSGLLQAAVGRVLSLEISPAGLSVDDDSASSCLAELKAHLVRNRDLAAAELSRLGMPCVLPHGGWFMLIPVAPRLLPLLTEPLELGTASDVPIVETITRHFSLAAIPASLFYSAEFRTTVGHGYLRICLNKKPETIIEGLKLLESALAAADAAANVETS